MRARATRRTTEILMSRSSSSPLPAPEDTPAALTIAEACLRFRLSRRTLTNAIREGRLRAARFGRAVRLDVRDLRAFLEAAKGSAS